MNRLKANVDLNARTYHLDFITAMLDPSLMQEIRVPSGIGIRGNIQADGSRYATRLAITEGRGRMKVDAKIDAKTRKDGSIDMNRLAYQAKIQAHNIQAKHFLPNRICILSPAHCRRREWEPISFLRVPDYRLRHR